MANHVAPLRAGVWWCQAWPTTKLYQMTGCTGASRSRLLVDSRLGRRTLCHPLDAWMATVLAIAEFTAHGADRPGRMIRRGRFKLNHYLEQPVELYDLDADPNEFNDLAGHPAYTQVQGELTEQLLTGWDPIDIDQKARESQHRRGGMLRGNVEPDRRWTHV